MISLLIQAVCERPVPVILVTEVAGDRIQILQLLILVPIGPACQKAKEGFLRQVFRRGFIVQAVVRKAVETLELGSQKIGKFVVHKFLVMTGFFGIL
jgi:hypothetical protein